MLKRNLRVRPGCVMSNRPVIAAGQVFMLLLACCVAGYAQSGCAQASPENPSVVLALLGGGIAALSLIRARHKSK